MRRALLLLLLAGCGPDYCPRVSQRVPSFVCYPEEQTPVCAQGLHLECVEVEPDPLGGGRTGRFEWRSRGACP